MTNNDMRTTDELRDELGALPVRPFDEEMIEAVLTTRPSRRRPWLLAIAAVAVLGVAGAAFLQQRLPSNPALATPSPSVSSAQPNPSGSASASVTPTQTPSTSPSAADPVPPTSSVSSPQTPVTTQPSLTTVDAADYASVAAVGAGWYFASPDGDWLCGIAESGMVGCQSRVAYPSMPECGTNPDYMAPLVSWQAGDAQAVASCTTEGLFVAAISEAATGPENRVLPQGSFLQVNGVVCEALPGAISCYPEGTNGGFHITADQIRT